jgi:V/A-type H+/Na+-transporting ATPase subunit A
LLSWTRYFDQMAPWYADNLGPQWVKRVHAMLDLLQRGDGVAQMMQVTGEEGVSLDDYIVYEKAKFLDMIYLQQDAFDPVDVSVPLDRQKVLFDRVCRLCERDYDFADKAAVQRHFTRLTGLFKNLNYSPKGSTEYQGRMAEIETLDAAVPALRAAVTEDA